MSFSFGIQQSYATTPLIQNVVWSSASIGGSNSFWNNTTQISLYPYLSKITGADGIYQMEPLIGKVTLNSVLQDNSSLIVYGGSQLNETIFVSLSLDGVSWTTPTALYNAGESNNIINTANNINIPSTFDGNSIFYTKFTGGVVQSSQWVGAYIQAISITVGGVSELFEPPTNSPPVSLSISDSTQPVLTYSVPNNATGIQIFRNGTLIGTESPSSTSFTDTTLQQSGTYSYSVGAVFPFGDIMSNTVEIIEGNSVPITISGSSSGSSQVTINWPLAQEATGFNIIDNGTIVNSSPLSSSTTSYTFTPTSPGLNKIYLQSLTSSGYLASNLINVDNIISSKSLDYTLIAYNASNTGFISYLDGVFTKYFDNNSQNIIVYPPNTTICQSAS